MGGCRCLFGYDKFCLFSDICGCWPCWPTFYHHFCAIVALFTIFYTVIFWFSSIVYHLIVRYFVFTTNRYFCITKWKICG